ncbi:choice-of-anchor D domain-containing protein [Puteibacter caeruleilacunae]|nr:choice-of-anchor D domain-containing protein [Puteibacter caeruleilacunae]
MHSLKFIHVFKHLNHGVTIQHILMNWICSISLLTTLIPCSSLAADVSDDSQLFTVQQKTVTRAYVIFNHGQSDLILNDESITITGPAADDFSILQLPAQMVPPGESTNFTVVFNPKESGLRLATITITSATTKLTIPLEESATIVKPPSVLTIAATDVTSSSAVIAGKITDNGGLTVTQQGFVYSASDNTPTIGEERVAQIIVDQHDATFSTTISNLNGTYYYQSYATNAKGTSYGGVEQFSTLSLKMNVKGNNQLIASDDQSPSLEDHTDFGSVKLEETSTVHEFTIENPGEATINLPEQAITISGDHVNDFRIIDQPTSLIEAGSSAKFSIDFHPSETGVRSAMVSIVWNDNTYTFAIQGTGQVNPPQVIINEVNVTPTDQEFIEIYDGGKGNSPLDGLVLVLFNGSDHASYKTFDLSGESTNKDGYFVLGKEGVPHVNKVFSSPDLQDGPDAIAIYEGKVEDFPNDFHLSTSNLMDAFVYNTNGKIDAAFNDLLNANQPQVNEDSNNKKSEDSSQRIPNGEGGPRNTAKYMQSFPTPGEANQLINDPPVISPYQEFDVFESAKNYDYIATIEATPADAEFSNWKIIGGNTDNVFGISSDKGEIFVNDNRFLDAETTKQYILQITVSDGKITSKPEKITINVKDANEKPIAIIGEDQSVGPNTLIQLDGSKSYDPEGKPLTYTWTSSSFRVKFSDCHCAKPTFMTPDDNSKHFLIISLVVNDGEQDSEKASIKVIVDPKTTKVDRVSYDSEAIKIYPNPSKGDFSIRLKEPPTNDVLMKISNVGGQVIHTQELSAQETQIETNLKSGIYLIQLQIGHNLVTRKVCINEVR